MAMRLILTALVVITFTLIAHATPCVQGTVRLSTIMGTTCDIGSMTFTFDVFNGHIYSPSSFFYASDVNFTALSNGFTLSLLLGPQSLGSPQSGNWNQETAILYFHVTSSLGITQAHVSWDPSDYAVNGGGSKARNAIDVRRSTAPWADTFEWNELNYYGSTSSVVASHGSSPSGYYSTTCQYNECFLPITDGMGTATLTELYTRQESGGTSYWNAHDTTFTFDTASASVPEPSIFVLLSTGLMALAGVARRKQRC